VREKRVERGLARVSISHLSTIFSHLDFSQRAEWRCYPQLLRNSSRLCISSDERAPISRAFATRGPTHGAWNPRRSTAGFLDGYLSSSLTSYLSSLTYHLLPLTYLHDGTSVDDIPLIQGCICCDNLINHGLASVGRSTTSGSKGGPGTARETDRGCRDRSSVHGSSITSDVSSGAGVNCGAISLTRTSI